VTLPRRHRSTVTWRRLGSFRNGLVAACVTISACGAPGYEKLEATSFGDTSNPPAPRVDPNAPGPCGAGGLTESGQKEIPRAPYLQRVTSDSALVSFTSTSRQATYTVELTGRDESAVGSVEAIVDDSDPSGDQRIARLDDLEAGSTYCYVLPSLTRPSSLTTAPAPGGDAPVRFVAFGDSGSGSAAQAAIAEQMATVPFDLVLHTGDVAYDEGTLEQLERTFFAPYAPLLARAPAFLVAGNHDHGSYDAAPFRQVFALPDNGTDAGSELWYSMDWGDVHFVALDTERPLEPQRQWLERDLSETTLPWKVAFMHRPAYSSGWHGSDIAVREAFSDVFAEHGVQLALAGHDHDYERTAPMDGVTYVVTGGGGKNARPVGSSDFTAFSEDVMHFVYVAIQGTNLSLHAIDGVGQEFDSLQLSR